jgi:hypothetical protein
MDIKGKGFAMDFKLIDRAPILKRDVESEVELAALARELAEATKAAKRLDNAREG